MSTIIDRRSSGTRSTSNQERLQRRVRARLKKAVEKMARSGSIEDLANADQPISIPTRDLHEPSFRRDLSDASWERVLPGNKEYQRGDEISKPEGGASGQGREGSPDGLGEDEVAIVLSADEFLDLLFDGLALPNLRKTSQGDVQAEQWRRAGFIKDGSPSRMHVGRTMRAARARRLALRAGKRRELQELEEARSILQQEISARMARKQDVSLEQERLRDLDEQIAVLTRKIKAIPFIDEADLRFAHIDQQPHPITNAVMFCVMDVSGSMGEKEKDLAKRFFLLLYLFLHRHYQAVNIVFIKHHSTATECTEQAFFGAREGGGTLVSPAIELTENIINQRFPAERWNVYVAQVSDGDNYFADNAVVADHLNQLLPRLRNLFYLEVNRESESDLLQLYEGIAENHPELITARASAREDIYPLFRALFSREELPQHG
ncbi:YeaH/YhbH family protein [Acidithiobacillus montserratensis]|uniref:YeaH/YhbH family protein n=1 Tax=Acidithiobacillus montserratensis TaxID=2729135 RepID=A0ACD5HGG1_9PROT|nr:YeaH/YhbH family protein [Acidithiobacillus montserratensis]MBU2746884.1 YeaH/YhbH family protein [Acidithiobacillus montserratensis]